MFLLAIIQYRGSPDSTIFVLPDNRTIEKIVLSGDWFSTKIAIYDIWIFKVPFLCSFYNLLCSFSQHFNLDFLIKTLHLNTIGSQCSYLGFRQKVNSKSYYFGELVLFLLKIVLYREIWLFSKILNSYYTGDCTKWIHTKRGPPVSIIALQTFFNSIPTCCKDDIVKNTEETREDQNSVKKVPITRPFYHSQKVPPHWDQAFWSKGCLSSYNFFVSS